MSIQSVSTPNFIPAAVPAPTSGTRSSTGSNGVMTDEKAELSVRLTAHTAAETDQKQQLETAVKAVKDFVQPMASNLEFQTDDESGRMIVKITDSSSGELIRQIPSEEMLEIAKALDRLQGLLVRQKA